MTNTCSLIASCIQGNPGAVRFFIPLLLQTILPLLSSPLAAPRVSSLFIKLKESAFYEVDRIHRFFGMICIHALISKKQTAKKFLSVTFKKCVFVAAMIANVTLRLCKPQCAMDPEWTSEAIKTQIKRAVSQLFETTVTPKTNRRSRLPTMDEKAFPAPTFAYCFYLLKEVLKGLL